MSATILHPTTIEKIEVPGGPLWLIREDLSHPVIEGGKARKLIGYLQLAQRKQVQVMTTVGGPHSRHLVALGFLTREQSLRAFALIKNRYLSAPLTPTLIEAQQWGVELVGVSSEEVGPLWSRGPCGPDKAGNIFVPAGGLGAYGLPGYRTLQDQLHSSWAHKGEGVDPPKDIYLSAGTGMAALGIAWALGPGVQVWVLPCYGALPSRFYALADKLGLRGRLRILTPISKGRLYKGKMGASSPALLGRAWEEAYDLPLIQWLSSPDGIEARGGRSGWVVVSGRASE